MITNDKRLIESAFPLKQVSLDSVHEKNVRHGHISTLHIWPARRPLAASRAALIATLLPDPGDADGRRMISERMAGRVTQKIERKRVNGRVVEKVKDETVGGILHWGREGDPGLDWFRDEIRTAYGGQAPKVLDPFAGGGAIPLEAMRLGCDVTAMDINPVAWFILKCTLQYPQQLAGHTRPLPTFALKDRALAESFLKSKGFKGAALRTQLERLGHSQSRDGIQLDALSLDDPMTEASLAWHVRAWGRWVLARARGRLAPHYPTYAEFEPLTKDSDWEPRQRQLLDLDSSGVAQLGDLNAEYTSAYLDQLFNPRWIAKPPVAYIWARTVACKQCRMALPLLKTCWLSKTGRKRVLLEMRPANDRPGVSFDVQFDPPQVGGNAAQRREHDRRIGAGTMSRTGATCPCCGAIMTMRDLRHEGLNGRLGQVMVAVVVDGVKGKEYRLPTDHERSVAKIDEERLLSVYGGVPFGLPDESTPKGGIGASRAFSVDGYGFDTWRKLFTNRQLLALGEFVRALRELPEQLTDYPDEWKEAVAAMCLPIISRMADRGSALSTWTNDRETIRSTFARFALPITWDFSESAPLSDTTGGFVQSVDWVFKVCEHLQNSVSSEQTGRSICASATGSLPSDMDVIITDPPYYDAIPYSDLMDFFYVWLRRSVQGVSKDAEKIFADALGPKWDHDSNDGELIDDASRFGGNKGLSKINYEDGMARSFRACHAALKPDGRLVVVFANKHPEAWESLVAALIKSGFVVNCSWPIQTEMGNRNRAIGSAALSSSVWLVCKKRAPVRPGWDNVVLEEMRRNITQQLRDFWDAGVRGPDFVWAATGPALEAFSKYPVVRKANSPTPDEMMTVSEFLREVRRMVVDFVVGRVLTLDGEEEVTGLDDVTTYYLLHRHDFGVEDAPVGACILYALSCNVSDSTLVKQYDLLVQSGRSSNSADLEDEESELVQSSRSSNSADLEDEESEEEADSIGGGANVKLKPWQRRNGRSLGVELPGGRPVPLIDQVHRLMHLWKAGDQVRVNQYLDERGLQSSALFNQLLQALIELAPAGSEERSILESISNHCATRGDVRAPRQRQLQL